MRLMGVVWVRLPDLPVTVTVAVPIAAEDDAVRVRIREFDAVPTLKAPTTPAGIPEALTVTVPVKPFCAASVIALIALPPGETARAAGEADRVKVGAVVTVRATDVLAVSAPDVPVMVTVEAPAAAVEAAVKVTTLTPVALAAPKVAVTPLGSPDAARATVAANPFWAPTAMELVALEPVATLKLAGVAASVKLGGGVTVREMVALALSVPDVPVTVTVAVPAAAVLAAVKVKVLVVLVLVEPKAAVTPVGRPLTARLTALLNPFSAPTVMVLVPVPPGETLRVAGDAVRV